ncbi:long-chain-fatty-acid--CoA ligase [Streptomyces sulfonofaciens]|uniref:Long-chain-fatty-acid--CoA ligase n=1 Tax=Streptomyces sulfonofaciens TaxID=68272 RepID=A0A919G7H9_9ACTN|nr:long-chain fatty acid--CoA ligase [Streptomyces sulfonofaciens]GHH79266.1 long-chain-fatty-acid--CoA ligase [Streptomyces sulfonofaciens]
MTNLAGLLDEAVAAFPARTAVVSGDIRLSYARLAASASQVAHLLKSRGVGRGDTVALSCPNTPAFTMVYFGILKTGAAVVPLNILLKGQEIAYHLNDSGAKAYFAFEGTPHLPMHVAVREGFERAEGCSHLFVIPADASLPLPWADQDTVFETTSTDDEDTAVILYTSGTTGRPKGAELRHRNMRANALCGAAVFGCDAERPDTYLATLPLFHSFGQTVVQNGAVAYAGTVVMMPRFEPQAALQLIVAERVTVFAGVPTMYWGLLSAVHDAAGELDPAAITDTLRIAVSGGSALPVEIHRRFRERFGVTILEGYGLSETSPVVSFSVRGEEPRPGSIGVPIPGVEMRLVDGDWNTVEDDPKAVGEIAVRGHNVMKGYLRNPEATAEATRDGWLRTGDLARKDADGYFYIVDRSKDMIIRGGYNVYPREIEELLMTHQEVSLVAVIGIPDASHGEDIKAVVVPTDASRITPEELRAWAKERLAAYKYPRIVEFVDTLPMTSTGKILKRELIRGHAPADRAAALRPGPPSRRRR